MNDHDMAAAVGVLILGLTGLAILGRWGWQRWKEER